MGLPVGLARQMDGGVHPLDALHPKTGHDWKLVQAYNRDTAFHRTHTDWGVSIFRTPAARGADNSTPLKESVRRVIGCTVSKCLQPLVERVLYQNTGKTKQRGFQPVSWGFPAEHQKPPPWIACRINQGKWLFVYS